MTTETIERRASAIELRAAGRKLTGYAAIFNTRARVADFDEEIRSGAFADSLKSGDKLALLDHDTGKLLARTKSGTLKLAEDSKGLHFEIAVPDTTLGRDVLALAERGDLGGASFGFIATRDAWAGSLRTLQAVDLREISIVSAWPAYPQTTVSARSAALAGRSVFARRLALLELGGGR